MQMEEDMRRLAAIHQQVEQVTTPQQTNPTAFLRPEQQAFFHQEVEAAQQAQYMQQSQFQAQLKKFESMRSQNRVGALAAPENQSRFNYTYRPMQMCRKLKQTGVCPRGDECTFAHTVDELHPMSTEKPREEAPNPGKNFLSEQQIDDYTPQFGAMQMRKKREMCHRLKRDGCLLGKKCQFAHTEDELGTVDLVYTDRVKTRVCRFWESGKCLYGSKYCVNAHGLDEIGHMKPSEDLLPPAKIHKHGGPV